MKLPTLSTALLAVAFLSVAPMQAEVPVPQDKPIVYTIPMDGGGSLFSISDNGKWACGDAANADDPSTRGYATLVNAETGEVHKLYDAQTELVIMSANDVTNDGDVAGCYQNRPAIYRRDENRWQYMPITGEWETCDLKSISPDGKYACGTMVKRDWTVAGFAFKIDGDNVTRVEFKGINKVSRCNAVTPDGKVIGIADATVEGGGWTFIYDIETDTYTTSFAPGVSTHLVSPSGRYVGGFRGETITVYDRETGEFIKRKNNNTDLPAGCEFLDDNLNFYGNTEHDLMFRNWYVHVGSYWYDFREVLLQKYGIDWQTEYAKDDMGYSGTFWVSDSSGKVLTATDYVHSPRQSYIIRMAQSFNEICPTLNLLSTYAAVPKDGASFSRLQTIELTFGRDIEVLCGDNAVKVIDENGTEVANSISVRLKSGETKKITVAFRNRTLEEGKQYRVVIPTGAISVKGDAERINDEITLTYIGRPNRPVAPVKVYPEDGNEVRVLSLTTSPIMLTFDTDLTLCENPSNEARINLYLVSEAGDELITPLNASMGGNQVMIYPVNERRLAKGSTYKIVVNAGTFADLSGACPNEKYSFTYKGIYDGEPSANEKVIFSDDFSNGLSNNNWMFYEGDHNNPSDEMRNWDFTADTTPWWFVRDTNQSTDWAACSHSWYNPGGQSDDWMVTYGLNIGDDSYVLKFDSQSYKTGKEDRLKVYAYATNDVITALTPSIVNKIRYEGKVIYNEVQDPGEREEYMEGEWRLNEIPLSEFAGKNIYIAFVNDNVNQSAIFLDNVEVSRDLKIALDVYTPEYAVNQDDIEISGRFTVVTNSASYSDINITLYDADNKVVDNLLVNDKTYKTGDSHAFAFAKKLPLEKGKRVNYRVELTSGDANPVVNSAVKNLAFETTKKVVLEEYTGTSCQFCPQGIAVIELLEKQYGEHFIPIAIHGYTGSQFETTTADEYSSFLGLSSAPSAAVNRKWAGSPMAGAYEYLVPGEVLWYNKVAEELEIPADADVKLDYYNVDPYTRTVTVNASVRYGYDADNLNLNLFTVILEDKLMGVQTNGVFYSTSQHLGEWANGGKYASEGVLYEFADIMRGVNGTTYNGTGGHLPSKVEAGKTYRTEIKFDLPQAVYMPENTKAVVMLIDGNVGNIINADRSVVDYSGVQSIESDDARICVSAADGQITINCTDDFDAQIWSIDGKCISNVHGNGRATIDLSGYKGIAVVRVKTADSILAKKLILK